MLTVSFFFCGRFSFLPAIRDPTVGFFPDFVFVCKYSLVVCTNYRGIQRVRNEAVAATAAAVVVATRAVVV